MRRRRPLPLLLLLSVLAAACVGTGDRPRDSAAATRAVGRAAASPPPATVAATPSDSSDAEAGGPATELAANDPWLAAADSAIRRHLAQQLFLAPRSREFDRCSDDDGSENPTIGAAAVSARPIRRTHAELEPAGYVRPMRRATYDVEVRSVAMLVPQWIAKFPLDSTMMNTFPYQGVIGARTDTFSVSIGQMVDPTSRAGWNACDPTGPAVSVGDGPGFWYFAHAIDQPNKDMRVVRWVPADGSWARVVALADSVSAGLTSASSASHR